MSNEPFRLIIAGRAPRVKRTRSSDQILIKRTRWHEGMGVVEWW